MKGLMKFLLMIVLAFTAFGCATSGPKFSEMMGSIPELSSDTGRIVVYRKSAFGAAIQPKVYLNEEVVGRSVPKGFFFVDKPAGNYEIKTTTEVKRILSLTLENGQIRYVRLNVSMGFLAGHVYPELVENDVGESEIQNMRYIGKD